MWRFIWYRVEIQHEFQSYLPVLQLYGKVINSQEVNIGNFSHVFIRYPSTLVRNFWVKFFFFSLFFSPQNLLLFFILLTLILLHQNTRDPPSTTFSKVETVCLTQFPFSMIESYVSSSTNSLRSLENSIMNIFFPYPKLENDCDFF